MLCDDHCGDQVSKNFFSEFRQMAPMLYIEMACVKIKYDKKSKRLCQKEKRNPQVVANT